MLRLREPAGGSYPAFSVVVVDDDQAVLDAVRAVLQSAGITNILCLSESPDLLEKLERTDVGVVLLDLVMPGLSGEELIPLVRQQDPELPLVIVAGNQEVDKAVECMKAGADDYLTKPVELSRLVATVRRFIEIQELRRENVALGRNFLSAEPDNPSAFVGLVTRDQKLQRLLRYAETIARTRHPVLITGETGVGKELVARGIHRASRRVGEFVAVNIAGLDEAMFSDMLFGHRAGAFTGATASLSGLVERAAHGTLFLDEIGDLAHGSQVKLLRLLESGEFYPVGSDVHRRAETRVVVATNTDIEEAVRNGRFRRDLYYRLRTHHIEVPPLRSRPGDIPVLVRHFAEEAAMELGRKPPTVPDAVNALLGSYPFPGNVRELRSLVFDAVGSRESSSLPLELFRPVLGKPQDLTGAGNAQHADGAGLLTIRQTVDRLVEQALEIAHGNRLAAARILGITPQALGQRMKRSRSA